MASPVVISTPMPTLEELGKELGLSRAEQNSLIRLVESRSVRRTASRSQKLSADAAVKSGTRNRNVRRSS